MPGKGRQERWGPAFSRTPPLGGRVGQKLCPQLASKTENARMPMANTHKRSPVANPGELVNNVALSKTLAMVVFLHYLIEYNPQTVAKDRRYGCLCVMFCCCCSILPFPTQSNVCVQICIKQIRYFPPK